MPNARNLTFPAASGRPMRAYLAEPEGDAPAPGVIVIHELFGLNDDIRRIADRFAGHGYAALAPDLHDTGGPRLWCIAKTMRALGRGRGAPFDDLEAARDWLAARDAVDGARIGVVGFCMGGGFALLYAAQAPLRASATYYGMVPDEADRLSGICPTFAGYGGLDRQLREAPAVLERHLDTLGVPHEIEVYETAGHSYMNQHGGILGFVSGVWPMNRMHIGYNEHAAEDSWRRMLDFFATHLQATPGGA